jgi:CO dehydrogenase/acetyl-CoA synthase alpha subunit
MRNDKVNQIIKADDSWEPVGHTPMPEIPDLRNWDMRLLKTYAPFYAPVGDRCNFCTYGECDLSEGKKGACGIDINTWQAKVVLQSCCNGLSASCCHARHILDYLINKRGRDYKINLGDKVAIEAPHIRTVLGLKPETLSDLENVLSYIEGQLVHLISSVNTWKEGSTIDFESKSLQASMLGFVAMEVADIAQISGFNFPTSQADTPFVNMGWGAIDRTKSVILVIGENPITAICIIDYLKHNNLEDKVEVVGIGSVAHEITRYSQKAKIIGPLSHQLSFIRCGVADIIVAGGQCVLTDIPTKVAETGSALIATSYEASYGLEDMTKVEADEIVRGMVEGKQALVYEPEKAAEVVVRVALELAPKRREGLVKDCEQSTASWETWKIRVGRGPVMDTEIRKVGAPLVLGTIPGIIAIVGGSNYPEEITEVAEIAEEFARRKYIVVLSGCSAIAVGMKKDNDGKTLYEKYPSDFDAGGIINIGSCVANAHITGAAIKIANIFAALPLRGNYEVIADYILNRVGACGLAWGACSEQELSVATGCNRLGIPVIVGPRCIKYGRLYISHAGETDWTVMDGREKKLVDTEEPSPEHLLSLIGSKGEAMVTMAKLCIRKNDTPQGRATKLTHYIALHKQYLGALPDDLHFYIRRTSEIPIFFKKEVMAYLEKVDWKEKPVLSLPTLVGTYPSEVSLDAVVH